MRRPTSNPTRSSTVSLCSAAFWDSSNRMGDLVGVGDSVTHIFFISFRNQGGGTNSSLGPTMGSEKNSEASLGSGSKVCEWTSWGDSPSVSLSVASARFSRSVFRSSPLREAMVGWPPSIEEGGVRATGVTKRLLTCSAAVGSVPRVVASNLSLARRAEAASAWNDVGLLGTCFPGQMHDVRLGRVCTLAVTPVVRQYSTLLLAVLALPGSVPAILAVSFRVKAGCSCSPLAVLALLGSGSVILTDPFCAVENSRVVCLTSSGSTILAEPCLAVGDSRLLLSCSSVIPSGH